MYNLKILMFKNHDETLWPTSLVVCCYRLYMVGSHSPSGDAPQLKMMSYFFYFFIIGGVRLSP
jgi:hypothetical protein